MKKDLPQIGKIYNHFDDGKINESRRMNVEILSICKFEDINKETKEYWEEEVVAVNKTFKIATSTSSIPAEK